MFTTIRRLGLLVLISFSFSPLLQAAEERLPSPNFVRFFWKILCVLRVSVVS